METQVITGRKKLTLTEQIEKLEYAGDEVIFNLIGELEADNESAIGYRWHEPSTQDRQDRHLKLYRSFIRTINRLPPDAMAATVDSYAFPAESSLFFKNARLFLMWVFKFAKPRTEITGQTHIDYRSLVSYRSSLQFWANRKFAELRHPPIDQTRLFNQITEAMRFIQRKEGGVVRNRVLRAGLGLAELRQLMDYEISTNACIENSEQHQLIWCICRQTALRPGSLGPGHLRPGHLQWKDVTITAGDAKGTFHVRIDIRYLKTNKSDPEKGMVHNKTLQFYLSSQSSKNLIFSVPHRLLCIALRRNILCGISSTKEMLASDKHEFLIKKEHLEDPVFYKSGPRGLSIDNVKPLTSQSMSQYLADRGTFLGYRTRISIYDIRRRTATDLVHKLGLDAAREIMGHVPESRALERYYLNSRPRLDLSAAMLDEPIGAGGVSTAMAKQNSTIATTKLSNERLARLQGAALNAMVDKLVAADPYYPEDEAELKNYMRRMRRLAFRTLLDELHNEQREDMTRTEMRDRLRLAEASTFASKVLSRALEKVNSGPSASATRNPHISSEESNGVDFETEFKGTLEDVEAQDTAEDDAEDVHDSSDTTTRVNVPTEDCDVADISDMDVPYVVAAESFMDMLMNNSLSSSKPWLARESGRCPLCQVDETMSDDAKSKVWDTEWHLKIHMEGTTHAPVEKWRRRRKAEFAEDSVWQCPYCPLGTGVFSHLQSLVRHVEMSNSSTHGSQHDDLKSEDGWYDGVEFYGMPSRNAQKRQATKIIEHLRLDGLDLADQSKVLLQAVPHETIPGLFRGPLHEPGAIRRELSKRVKLETTWTPGQIPEHLKGLMFPGNSEEAKKERESLRSAIPAHLEGLMFRGNSEEAKRERALLERDNDQTSAEV